MEAIVQEEMRELREENRVLREEISQIRASWSYWLECELRSCWHDILCWKWIIFLIAVELWRLHVDTQHWTDLNNVIGGLTCDLHNLLDAVDPRG